MAGIDNLSEYAANKKKYEAEIQAAEEKLAEYAAQATPGEDYFEKVGQVRNILLDPSAPMEQKQKAARSVIQYAIFNKNRNSVDIFLYFH